MRLNGKVSIITGAGQGIGRATAIKFAQRRRQGRGLRHQPGRGRRNASRRIRAPAAKRAAFRVDVTDKDSIARMVEGVMAKWGRIDTLVNNAGIVAGRAVQEDDRRAVRARHRRQPEGRLQLHQGRGRHHARSRTPAAS